MFYARFIQCFNIKYLQFLLLIFSFFSIHPNPLWGSTWGNVIRNCGLNQVPIKYNPVTGLSAQQAPLNNNKKD